MSDKSLQSEVTEAQWIANADRAFFRLREIIDLAQVDDPKLLRAIEQSFDRAYGKVVERTELTGKDGSALVPFEEVLRRIETLRAKESK